MVVKVAGSSGCGLVTREVIFSLSLRPNALKQPGSDDPMLESGDIWRPVEEKCLRRVVLYFVVPKAFLSALASGIVRILGRKPSRKE